MGVLSFLDIALKPLFVWSPLGTLLILSLLITLITTLVYKWLTNQELMKSLREEIKGFQREMKDHKDNPSKAMEIQKKSMEKNIKYMMHSFKPMLVTFIPLLLIFGWLRRIYGDAGPLIFGLSWIWVYIISTVIFSIIIRKALKVH